MKVGIHEAKTKLSKLIPAVLAGEEVIITKAGQSQDPVAAQCAETATTLKANPPADPATGAPKVGKAAVPTA